MTNSKRKLDGVLSNEDILTDNYPVYCDYFYVCDGKVNRSPIQGYIRDLKRALNVKEIRWCDVVQRNLL